jgi:uncharacterized protein YndB with AHSA1/START domain
MNPVIIEADFQTSAAQVWHALTDVAAMKQWYFDIAEFKTEPGFEFEFIGGTPEKPYKHHCTITEVIPLKKLAYTWRYEGYSGESLVIFELSELGTKTHLKLSHEGVDSFPVENPDLKRENFEIGWSHIMNISLKNYLEI